MDSELTKEPEPVQEPSLQIIGTAHVSEKSIEEVYSEIKKYL